MKKAVFWERRHRTVEAEMDQLLEGIKVFVPEQAMSQEAARVALSRGTLSHKEFCSLKGKYQDRAILPQTPWISPDEHSLATIFARRAGRDIWTSGKNIGILPIPPAILRELQRPFTKSLTSAQLDPTEYADALAAVKAEELLPVVQSLMAGLPWDATCLDFLQLHTAPPGLATITMESTDPAHSRLMGMHLDSVDAVPRQKRFRARSRFCLNIGSETRYLLYVNQTLGQLFELLPELEQRNTAKYFRGPEVGYEFFRCFPHYPIVRLAIHPGEGYIAPTDNMIHDASTSNKACVDITLHFAGHFSAQC